MTIETLLLAVLDERDNLQQELATARAERDGANRRLLEITEWPTCGDDVLAYHARSLLEQLRDTGPVGKRVPMCVVTAMRAAADEIERLQRLADYLDDPQVLLAIPQPHRMKLSELLHQSTTT